MEDIKLFIYYIKENVMTFFYVISSPKSPALSKKILKKENTKEISLYLIFILLLINSFYLSANKSEILSITLVKLTLLSFLSFIIQSIIFRFIFNAVSTKKEDPHIFFNILSLSSTFSLLMTIALTPLIERDFLQISRAVITFGGDFYRYYSYSPTIPINTALISLGLVILCVFIHIFFISYQLKSTTNSTFKKSFFIGTVSYILNYYIMLKTYGQFSYFILEN